MTQQAKTKEMEEAREELKYFNEKMKAIYAEIECIRKSRKKQYKKSNEIKLLQAEIKALQPGMNQAFDRCANSCYIRVDA